MENIGIIKISTKGQIVIPIDMRKDLKEGQELVIFKNNDSFVLTHVEKLSESLKEDLEFARRTEKALKRFDKGEFISMEGDDFLKELEKW